MRRVLTLGDILSSREHETRKGGSVGQIYRRGEKGRGVKMELQKKIIFTYFIFIKDKEFATFCAPKGLYCISK